MTKVLTKPLTMPAVDMVAFKKEVIKKGPHAKKISTDWLQKKN